MEVFFHDSDREYYFEYLKEKCEKYRVSIKGYCLMTNHVHLILTPEDSVGLSSSIREMHKAYTRRINYREATSSRSASFLVPSRHGKCERYFRRALK